LQRLIREFQLYYRDRARMIFAPEVEKREFMFMGFDDVVRRYISFKSLDSLRSYMADIVPRHAYYSVGLYKRPEMRKMEQRGFEGAEVLFDIDATGLEGCSYDLYFCEECSYEQQKEMQRCPSCGSERIKKMDWLDEACIRAAKAEVKKLLKILREDFGLRNDGILVSYTGNRGFHVRILAKEFLKLGKEERAEIAGYISARGFDYEVFNSAGGYKFPKPDEGGWRGRFSRALISVLRENKMDEIARDIEEGKTIERGFMRKRRWILEKAVSRMKEEAATVDEAVTFDIQRLTRVPNSLHGKTGLRAMTLTYDELDEFDPFTDAVGLSDSPVKVRITRKVPRFSINGLIFGPYSRDEVLELPAYAAALIVLRERGKAEI
jgi:DNA primase small subunit